MELEVSYNENYCVEGQVERRRGATDRDDRGGHKLWVQIVSIDTPSSSHRSALLETQICLSAHHEPSASLSQDQLGQLRRRGWGERVAAQRPQAAPCARRAPALHRKAVGAVDGQGKKQVEIGKQEELEGAQERQLPSTFKLPPPRTLPHARTATPMRFHRVLRASAPSHHATWWRAPPSSAASRRVRVSAPPVRGSQNCPVIPVISHQCMTWDHSSVDLYSYSVPF